jgi:hypothetical protein
VKDMCALQQYRADRSAVTQHHLVLA